jgi:hypothetical protein
MSPDCFHENPSSNLISSRDLKSGVTPGTSLLKAPEVQELCHAANASQFVPGGYSGSWPAEANWFGKRTG